MNLTRRIFLPLVTIILLLCFMEKPIKIEANQETNYLRSSKTSQTHTRKQSKILMPLSLPKAGEAKASLPHMRRIALNPTQYASSPGTQCQTNVESGLKKENIIFLSNPKLKGSKKITKKGEKKWSNDVLDKADSENIVIKLNSQSRVNDKQLQLLYSLVQAEAGNQDVDGCRLVADVVLNRMASEKFPNDLESVIYSPGQFSVVKNGALKKAQGEISQKVIQAVDMELSGKQLNNDVLYFNNKPNGGWQYGGHYFK